MPARKPTVTQSLVFRNEDWTLAKARKWLREHGHSSSDPDVLTRTTRFRQRSPKDFVSGSFRTIVLPNGVEVVLGHLKR
jgi:hypothetical protein